MCQSRPEKESPASDWINFVALILNVIQVAAQGIWDPKRRLQNPNTTPSIEKRLSIPLTPVTAILTAEYHASELMAAVVLLEESS